MFTGIVTAVGRVRRTVPGPDGGLDLDIAAPFRDLAIGESVAVNGACLTVTNRLRAGFRVHAVRTSIERTLVGAWAAGHQVNLERALQVGDRLGGHLVQGHVDGVAEVVKRRIEDDALLLDLKVPAPIAKVSIPLGSITVDGVSLTVNARPRPGIIQISLIPHTRDQTTLGALQPGDHVHVEGDVIGKYVQAMMTEPGKRRS